MVSTKLIFNGDTPQSQYEELYAQPVGTVFKIESDYETVMRRIEEYKPSNRKFEVFPINPGTDLFTINGADHSVITENELFPQE